MSRKPKFNPEITRVKLNPEQAVLACTCYTGFLAGTRAQPQKTVCTNPGTRDTAPSDWAAGETAAS